MCCLGVSQYPKPHRPIFHGCNRELLSLKQTLEALETTLMDTGVLKGRAWAAIWETGPWSTDNETSWGEEGDPY